MTAVTLNPHIVRVSRRPGDGPDASRARRRDIPYDPVVTIPRSSDTTRRGLTY